MTVRFLAPEQNRNLTIRLDRAATVSVTVLNHAGAPVATARVIHFRNRMRMEGHTNASGKVEVPIFEDQPVDVYVVPRDGSFGMATLKADRKETVIRIPDAVARIIVRAETDERAPISDIALLARYNGRVIPVEVFDAIAGTRGGRIQRERDGQLILAHMPVGLYEFWPVGSDAELRALEAGIGPQPRVRMVAAPGENVATMIFEPATKR